MEKRDLLLIIISCILLISTSIIELNPAIAFENSLKPNLDLNLTFILDKINPVNYVYVLIFSTYTNEQKIDTFENWYNEKYLEPLYPKDNFKCLSWKPATIEDPEFQFLNNITLYKRYLYGFDRYEYITDADFQDYNPNNLLKDEILRLGEDSGVNSYLHIAFAKDNKTEFQRCEEWMLTKRA